MLPVKLWRFSVTSPVCSSTAQVAHDVGANPTGSVWLATESALEPNNGFGTVWFWSGSAFVEVRLCQ